MVTGVPSQLRSLAWVCSQLAERTSELSQGERGRPAKTNHAKTASDIISAVKKMTKTANHPQDKGADGPDRMLSHNCFTYCLSAGTLRQPKTTWPGLEKERHRGFEARPGIETASGEVHGGWGTCERHLLRERRAQGERPSSPSARASARTDGTSPPMLEHHLGAGNPRPCRVQVVTAWALAMRTVWENEPPQVAGGGAGGASLSLDIPSLDTSRIASARCTTHAPSAPAPSESKQLVAAGPTSLSCRVGVGSVLSCIVL